MRTSEHLTSHCQVSFFIQPLSDGIKGHPFLSMLRDGLIEEQLIVGVMIADESRGTTLQGKIKDYVSGVSSPLTPYKRYGGVVLNRRTLLKVIFVSL